MHVIATNSRKYKILATLIIMKQMKFVTRTSVFIIFSFVLYVFSMFYSYSVFIKINDLFISLQISNSANSERCFVIASDLM